MKLTATEKTVLRLLSVHGLSDKGISEETGLSLNAVKVAIRGMCKRLGFGGPEKSPRVQLAVWGVRNGFGRPQPW